MELLLDGHHGIYIPQLFAKQFSISLTNAKELKKELECLKAGPDEEEYFESWEIVMDNAKLIGTDKKEYTLWQDDDLWALAEGEEATFE